MLNKVIYVPTISYFIISVSVLNKSNDVYVILYGELAFIVCKSSNRILVSFTLKEDGLYHCDKIKDLFENNCCPIILNITQDNKYTKKQIKLGSGNIRTKSAVLDLTPLEILHLKTAHSPIELIHQMLRDE